jgi:hypothetical protein
VKCKPADMGKGFWRVDNGTILADTMKHKGHNYVWLVTEKEYTDFALRLKFQAYKRSPGNSGIQLRSRYDDRVSWLDGPQIDIHPPGPWRTGMMWDETRGVQRWIFPDIPKGKWVDESMSVPARVFYYGDDAMEGPPADAKAPAGMSDSNAAKQEGRGQKPPPTPAWNEMEITAKGPRITAVMNGVTITDFDGTAILNDEAHRKYNVGLQGSIALQIHSGDQLEIRFKDLFIRELAP